MSTAADFIARWSASGASERANYQLFLSELCDCLGVPRPDPSQDDDSKNAYVFERNVKFQNPDGTLLTRPLYSAKNLESRLASRSEF